MRKTITTAAITAAGAGRSVPELADVTGGSEKSGESREPVRARGRTGCPAPRPRDNNDENQMPATRSASRTLRRIIKRTVAVGALVTIVGGGVVGGTAHAWTSSDPDLVGSGPTDVFVGNHTALIAHVKNDVNGVFPFRSAQASNATIKYQPLTRLTLLGGLTAYINTPGSTAITATATVGFLAAGANAGFSARSDRTPSGLNRITVCADSSGLVSEQSEVNNCYSEVKTVVANYFS